MRNRIHNNKYIVLRFSVLFGAMALLSLGLHSCSKHYAPKPEAYVRIALPEHAYEACQVDGLPFTFEKAACAQLSVKESKREGQQWVDLLYPQYRGVVYLTYCPLRKPADLPVQVDTSMAFLEQHYGYASGQTESAFESQDGSVHAVVYRLKGDHVASTYQFWATDSCRHFLRGALFMDCTPANDSLAPVITFIQEDLDHLLETLTWK